MRVWPQAHRWHALPSSDGTRSAPAWLGAILARLTDGSVSLFVQSFLVTLWCIPPNLGLWPRCCVFCVASRSRGNWVFPARVVALAPPLFLLTPPIPSRPRYLRLLLGLWSAQAHVPPQLPGTAGVGAHEHRRGRPCGRRRRRPQAAIGVGAAGVGAVGDSR